MKTLSTILIILLTASALFSQSPAAFNFQAVARSSSNEVMSNAELGIRVSILEGSSSGLEVFVESHLVRTDDLGQFIMSVGQGIAITDNDLSSLNWSSQKYYIRIDIDFDGGSSYTATQVSPLSSVPYAMHASTADDVDDADADSTNELQTLSIDGNTLSISGGNAVEIPTGGADADADPTNEIQSISKVDSIVTLSHDGGSFVDETTDADADPENEIQTLSLNGNTISISDGNSIELPTVAEDADSDSTNEIQTLDIVELENAGILNTNKYELRLSNSPSVDLPYIDWTDVHYFTSDSIEGLITRVPFYFENYLKTRTFDARKAVIRNFQTNISGDFITRISGSGISLGNQRTLSTHIYPGDIHFYSRLKKQGFQITNEEINYLNDLPSSDHSLKLTKNDLAFVNDAGKTSTRLGGKTFGALNLFPGGGQPAYFSVNYFGNRPLLALRKGAKEVIQASVRSAGQGILLVQGSNGFANVVLTDASSNPNHGYIAVHDSTGYPRAGILVNAEGHGIIYGDQKHFIIDHPNDDSKDIVYVSLEGPEVAAYERGTASLIDGQCTIAFSEHFSLVIGDNRVTVQVTPHSAYSEGLAVISKTSTGIIVKELRQGKGNYSFDWEVKGVRKGHEDFKPIQDKLKRPN